MTFEILLSIILGIGLAAACGFRVFLPLFIVSLLSKMGAGSFGLGASFEWIGSTPALLAFGIATLMELTAYFIPFVDNLLDTIAVPLAAAAGTLISMSTMVEMDPLLTWSIALIAGGGIAGLIKGTNATARGVSSVTTAGMANPVIATAETGASLAMTILAWFLPLLGFVFLILGLILLSWAIRKSRKALA